MFLYALYGKKTKNNLLGTIIENVSSSVFCVMKWNKKCIDNRF